MEKTQQQLCPDTGAKKLIMEVDTRWNSCFYMLERFLELRDPVTTCLCQLGRQELTLNQTEINMIQDVVTALRPFEQITRELSADKVTFTLSLF